MSEKAILPMSSHRPMVQMAVKAILEAVDGILGSEGDRELDRNQVYRLAGAVEKIITTFDASREAHLQHLERARVDLYTVPSFIKQQWPHAVAADFSDPEVVKITEIIPIAPSLDYRGQPMPSVAEYNPLNGIPID